MLFDGIVILLVAGAYGAAVPRSELRPHIVGGIPVGNIEKYPHQLSLENYEGHYCGASIITNTYALTAGQCTRLVGQSPNENAPRGDALRGGSTQRGQGIKHVVKRALTHPKYVESSHDYDVGVLEVEIPFVFGPQMKPVPLAYKSYPKAGTPVTLTGWGITEEEGSFSNSLQEVEILTIGLDHCNALYDSSNSTISPRMVCAGMIRTGGKDGCHGDRGSALIESKTGVQIGIMSWGLGCGHPNYPGVYTNVANPEIINFIDESIVISPWLDK